MKRTLSIPERHQLAVARRTLQMSDAFARFMGGPTKEEARRIITRLTGRPVRENPAGPIRVTIDKITTVADWRGQGVGWRTAVRRAAKNHPVFVLRYDGSGQLFFPDRGTVRVRTWRKVTIVRPGSRALPLGTLLSRLRD